MELSIRQVKAARALLGWSQESLSEKASVPLSTIKRIEAVDGDSLPASSNAEKIEKALIKAGIYIIYSDEHGGEGVRLKK